MKLCKECDEYKPYDPTQGRQTKASGFAGKVCWDCFVIAQRAKMRERNCKNPADRTYSVLVTKAQNALDRLAKLADTPTVVHQRKALEYDLERAKLKVVKFGPDAYDFTRAELRKAKIHND